MLGRAGRLTPGGLRAAIARAVMEVAPAKARKRREQAARDARVQRWAEVSGNAALTGRELPPAEVLAADQRIAGWARELKKAGLEGDMDVLRARAYLDLLLDKDSRPRGAVGGQDGTRPQDPRGGGPGQGGPGQGGPAMADGTARTRRAGKRRGPARCRPGSPGGSTSSPRWRPCWTWPTGPARSPGSGRSTRGSPGISRLPPPPTPRPPGASPSPTSKDTPSGTAAPSPNPKTTPDTGTNPANPARRAGLIRPAGPGTGRAGILLHGLKPARAARRIRRLDAAHRAATAGPDHRSRPDRHRQTATTGSRPRVTTPASNSGTCPRSGTPHVPDRSAADPPHCDFEHNIPYEAGGRSCLCNGGPKCRHDHRLKQHPRWKVEQFPDGTFLWTTPSGRQYTTEPTRYPI